MKKNVFFPLCGICNPYYIIKRIYEQVGFDWQEIYSFDNLQQKLNHMNNNPVKEEFVYLPEEYKYSSADRLCRRKRDIGYWCNKKNRYE